MPPFGHDGPWRSTNEARPRPRKWVKRWRQSQSVKSQEHVMCRISGQPTSRVLRANTWGSGWGLWDA